MESNHIGTPPARFRCWESKLFYVHNFPKLSDEKSSDNVIISKFRCFGHDWEFQVYPGGEDDATDGYASILLSNRSNDKVTIDYRINLAGVDLSSRGDDNVTIDKIRPIGLGISKEKLMQRSYLNNGTLYFKVEMRLSSKEYPTCILRQPCSIDNTQVFLDDETSDVAFHGKYW
jgi:hypothetical protein